MVEVNVIELEDGLEYIVVEALESTKNKYLFLVNKDDNTKKCIRLVFEKDGKEHLRKLYDDEFDEAIELFNAKYRNGKQINEE